MDRSFGASTSVMHTPSPLDRKILGASSVMLAPRGSPTNVMSQPLFEVSPSAKTTTSGKSVHFSPSQSQQWSAALPATPVISSVYPSAADGSSGLSRSPPSRLQSFTSTPPSTTRIYPAVPAAISGPLTHFAQETKAIQQAAPKMAEKIANAVISGKPRMPLGRIEVARRLRVNAVLLVLWWLSSRTDVYGLASGHLVRIVPSLDAPLHFLESSVLLLLFWNIADSMYRLNRLSSLPPAPRSRPTSPTTSRFSPLVTTPKTLTTKLGGGSPQMSSPLVRSSPKTRPSPSMSPSPSISRSYSPTTNGLGGVGGSNSSPFRTSSQLSRSSSIGSGGAGAGGGVAPFTPQTPLQSKSHPLGRRSVSSSLGVSPSGVPIGQVNGGEASSALAAFMARHSPIATNLHKSVSSREAIDELLADD